jgi:hypothetical protein
LPAAGGLGAEVGREGVAMVECLTEWQESPQKKVRPGLGSTLERTMEPDAERELYSVPGPTDMAETP